MRKIVCKYVEKIDRKKVESIGKIVNYKFPTDFIDFIMKNNGGYPVLNLIDVQGDEEMINDFLSFDEADEINAAQIYLQDNGMKEQDCIPFARDPGGNYFCFNRKDDSIWFWDHEECDEDNEPFWVCDDFQTFLEKLYVEEQK